MEPRQEFDFLADKRVAGHHPFTERAEQENGFLVCARNGRVVLCSPAAAEIYGGEAKAVEGMCISLLLLEHGAVDDAPLQSSLDLDGMSEKPGWRRCFAVLAGGSEIPLIMTVQRFEVDAYAFYLLKLSRLHDA